MNVDTLMRLTHFLLLKKGVCMNFNYQAFDFFSQQNIVFNLNYIFKSPSNFFCLDLKITISINMSETLFASTCSVV